MLEFSRKLPALFQVHFQKGVRWEKLLGPLMCPTFPSASLYKKNLRFPSVWRKVTVKIHLKSFSATPFIMIQLQMARQTSSWVIIIVFSFYHLPKSIRGSWNNLETQFILNGKPQLVYETHEQRLIFTFLLNLNSTRITPPPARTNSKRTDAVK